MSIIAERYKVMYDSGNVASAKLIIAVQRGLIADTEYTEITGCVYPATE